MTEIKKTDNIIIGAIGAFLIISPNLNVLESILTYCGIESHSAVRLISIGIFALIDLIMAFEFLKSRPDKRYYWILAVFNAVYILPLLLNFDKTEIAQYIIFVLPVTIFAVMLSTDSEIMEHFFRYLNIAVKLLFIVAIGYIILQYVGTERDYMGIVVIRNMTYGDMGYLFLTGFVVATIEFRGKRNWFSVLEIIIFSLAIFFSGTRSAILCVAFAIVLWIVLFSISKNVTEKEKKSVLIGIIAVSITIAAGLLIVPSGSRLNIINIDTDWSDFSLKDLIFETEEEESFDINVIYTPTGVERKISEIYEEEIVRRDTTKTETEDILHEDVSSGRNEIITLISEDDRAFAENYRPYRHRTFLWRTAIKEFKKAPITGNGPCYFKNKYDGFFPHNVLLEAMTDFGVMGLLIILGIGIFCFAVGIIEYKNGNGYYFGLILLLFSHVPRYLLYTTLYSNPTIALTVLAFLTPTIIRNRI